MNDTIRASLILALMAHLACGPATPDEPTTPDSEPVDDTHEPAAVDDGMAVEGLAGTLRRDEVDPVMNRAVGRFMRCYAEQLDERPFLLGDLALSFGVGRDGAVESVRVTTSTLGSRETVDCVLDVARGLRFPTPHGGTSATFDYGPVVFNPGDGTRPTLWERARVNEVLDEEENAAALDECPAVGIAVTMYIGPGGRVRSIGAVAPSPDQEEAARCFERVLGGFEYPDPGPRVAKLSLEF